MDLYSLSWDGQGVFSECVGEGWLKEVGGIFICDNTEDFMKLSKSSVGIY